MKRIISCMLVSVLVGVVFVACGKQEVNDTSKTQVEVVDEPETNVNGETESGKMTTDATLPSAEDMELAVKSREAYERFLKGEELLYFDKIKVLANPDEPEKRNGIFANAGGLTLEEFNRDYCGGMTEQWDEEYKTTDTLYSFIDCGADEIPELALEFTGGKLWESEYTDIFVIKLIDDKLELCYQDNAGYRSYCGINKYGYAYRGGSNSAFSHSVEYHVVDAAGDEHFVYNVEYTYGISSVYSPDADFDMYSKAIDDGAVDDVQVNIYNLNYDAVAFSNDDFDYSAYAESCLYTFFKVDEEGFKVDDTSIYEADSPYMTMWNSTKLPLYTEEEIDEELWERKALFGVTEKIENEADINDWKSIK
ncbi:MAG: hypothetical protein E7296_02555 [Lachnospiraceae bacterium]|jgi:hypothetical protein|nr:hypothetical protein [Lachnospiraceae bacterium]